MTGCLLIARGTTPVDDFTLLDTNTNSLRAGQMVSPRDYLFQISAFYFAEAGCAYCQTQFGLLNEMQKDLRASNPDFNIEILGVNDYSFSADNSKMTFGRALPWLQDTLGDQVWNNWGVTFRDVRILSPQNELLGVFNLTDHSLLISSNYATLKTMLMNAAKALDSDGDHLPDSWEVSYFGNLFNGSADDPDADGFDNFTELVFRTSPTDPTSRPFMTRGFNTLGQFEVTYRRWPGAMIDYLMEASPDLNHWFGVEEINPVGAPVILYDGTGSSLTTVSLSHLPGERTISFLRVKAVPRN
jgi:hypothetical protein